MHTNLTSLFYLDFDLVDGEHVLYVFRWINHNETVACVYKCDSTLKLKVIARDTHWLAVVVR